jgi:HSP20 family protein
MSTLTPARRLDPLMPFQNDFFRPFNDLFNSNEWLSDMRSAMPAVNIMDEKDAYCLDMAVPGMKKDDFRIDIDGNMLTIASEKETKKEEKDRKFTRREYGFRSFSRSFTLPEEVNREKINAVYADGILKLTIPKKERSVKPEVSRHIDVK